MPRPYRTIPPLSAQDILRFWSKVRIRGPYDCWEWQGYRTPQGYGQFHLWDGARMTPFLAHRVAWTIAHGPIPSGLVVCHGCDHPSCVNPGNDHLFTDTQAYNMCDMAQKGRSAIGDCHGSRAHPECLARGEHHGSAKLTDEAVRDIRRAYAAGGVNQKALGKEHGVGQVAISQIVTGKTWAHV